MTISLVYLLVTKGGGIDGRDPTDKGGKTVGVFGFEHTAKKSGNAPWCDVVPLAVDLDAAAKRAIAKLDPIERYALQRKGFKHKPG